MTTCKQAFELEEGWREIKQGLTKVKRVLEGGTDEQFTSQEYMSLYTTVYNMCVKERPHDFSEELCNRYRQFLEDYVKSKVMRALRPKHGEYLLKELVKRWGIYKIMVRWLSNMFGYLGRYYVRFKNLPKLPEVGLLIFRDLVYTKIKCEVKDVVIALIRREREGEQIDKALLKNALDIFVEFGMEFYEVDFESFMLEDTSVFYRRKASLWIQADSCPDYMIKAAACLNQEIERVGHYLHASSEQKLVDTVQQEVLIQYKNQILENEHSGCQILFKDAKLEDLARMFCLFSKIPDGLEPIVVIFTQHVKDKGVALVKQAEDEISEKKEKVGVQEHAFIKKIIDLHDEYLEYVTKCFMDHHLFNRAFIEAFTVFCNKSVARITSAELLSSYCDTLLKKGGSQKPSEDEIENTLEKVVKVLAFIDDKDLFAEFCRKKLAKRLLFGVSASIDHEQSILTKLKQLCGKQFTSKMEGMVMDIKLDSDNQVDFKMYRLAINTNSQHSIDIHTTVINTLQWPNYNTSALALPVEMEKCVTIYNEFYKAKNPNRKLSWIYSLGTCNMIGKFDTKQFELIVTTYQAALLLLFNDENRLSYNDIKKQLNLPDDDVVRILHSLSCAKYKILNKDPVNKTIGQNDSFELNTKFTDKMKRIKIPMPPVDERKKVQSDVLKDRPYVVDATIVRVMKSRNQLPFQQLIGECTQHLSQMFKPDMKIIKNQVESLINREYLARDRENPNLLNYIA